MAGSYSHCVTDSGQLRNAERLSGMLETGGDVYEAVEEMYGMIWLLAELADDGGGKVADLVEYARRNYRDGIAASPGVQT